MNDGTWNLEGLPVIPHVPRTRKPKPPAPRMKVYAPLRKLALTCRGCGVHVATLRVSHLTPGERDAVIAGLELYCPACEVRYA